MVRLVRRIARVTAFISTVALLRSHDAAEKNQENTDDLILLRARLGDALRPDGTTDFERLDQITVPVDLDAWEREAGHDGTPVVSPRLT